MNKHVRCFDNQNMAYMLCFIEIWHQKFNLYTRRFLSKGVPKWRPHLLFMLGCCGTHCIIALEQHMFFQKVYAAVAIRYRFRSFSALLMCFNSQFILENGQLIKKQTRFIFNRLEKRTTKLPYQTDHKPHHQNTACHAVSKR